METACFSTTKRGLVRCTMHDHGNVEHGRFGTRTYDRPKLGRKLVSNVPAAEKENSIRLIRFKKALQ